MGQYYKIIAKNTETNEIFYNARVLKGYQKYINEMKKKYPKMYWDTYFGAKLMEHSWNSCHLMTSVASMLKKGKFRLIWCGDYAEDDEIKDISNGEADYDMLWGDDNYKKAKEDGHIKFVNRCSLKGCYFLNHTKKEYIAFDDYIAKAEQKEDRGTWCISPISLMTAIGNGRGGGDYEGINEDKVGSWAWDEISIKKEFPYDFKKLDIYFKFQLRNH